MGWDVDDPDRLSYQEVREALDQMSDGDWGRSERFASAAAHGLLGTSGEDVLNEACVALLSGQRRFPRNVRTLIVLKSAVESEASNARKAAWERKRDGSFSVEPEGDADDSSEFDSGRQVAPKTGNLLTPEDEIIAKEQFDALVSALARDPDAELVAMAWSDGLRGANGVEATGLSASAYDAARKRLLRKREAADRQGDRP
jgi:hypothetical protein